MNYSTVHSLVNENITYVSCVFSTESYANDKRNVQTTSKAYTYKTALKDVKVDDLVIVECQGVSHNFGFAIVKVVAIDEEPDYSDNTNYKWVVGKLDLTEHAALIAEEQLVISNIKRLEKQAKREQLLKAMEAQGITQDAIKTLMLAKRI